MSVSDHASISPLIGQTTNKRTASVNGQKKSQPNEAPKRKYPKSGYENIMADRRVWRGPTFNLYKKTKDETIRPIVGQLTQPGHPSKPDSVAKSSPNLSPPRDPRARGDSLTLVLEEITDRPLESDNFYHFELAKVRPDTPPFTPATTFQDATTYIDHNDLFVFDREVKSLLEILIGQSVEQALLELVQEEEDLVKVEEHRLHQEYRNVQLAEEQRLVAQRRRFEKEEECRLEERRICEEETKRTSEKVEVAAYAKDYLQSLIPSVYEQLHKQGYFDNTIRRELQLHFVPWICENVGMALDDLTAANLATQNIVRQLLLEAAEEVHDSLAVARKHVYVPLNQVVHHLHHGHKRHNIAITIQEDSTSQ